LTERETNLEDYNILVLTNAHIILMYISPNMTAHYL